MQTKTNLNWKNTKDFVTVGRESKVILSSFYDLFNLQN